MQQRALPVCAILTAGAAAGVVGAITIDAYLLATVVGAFHATTPGGFYRYVASGALGRAAYVDPNAVWLGVLFHTLISIGWGTGYAYAAAVTVQIRTRPLTSGIVFGIGVMIMMQFMEVAANIYQLPNSFSLGNLFIAHVAFFGLPIAYTVDRLWRPQRRAAR